MSDELAFTGRSMLLDFGTSDPQVVSVTTASADIGGERARDLWVNPENYEIVGGQQFYEDTMQLMKPYYDNKTLVYEEKEEIDTRQALKNII